jgi:hypothetical protein
LSNTFIPYSISIASNKLPQCGSSPDLLFANATIPVDVHISETYYSDHAAVVLQARIGKLFIYITWLSLNDGYMYFHIICT